jgi:hypothetical protein
VHHILPRLALASLLSQENGQPNEKEYSFEVFSQDKQRQTESQKKAQNDNIINVAGSV